MRTNLAWWSTLVAAAGLIFVGCIDDEDDSDAPRGLPQADSTVMEADAKGDRLDYPQSFEEFLDYVYCDSDGAMCVVDGDIPLAPSMDALRDFYDEHVAEEQDVETHQQGLAVNWDDRPGHQRPDVWGPDERHDLSFCITDEFGEYKDDVVEATVDAAERWEEFANVTFRYLDDQDRDCGLDNDEVLFPVEPPPPEDNPSYNARAFFPHYFDLEVEDVDYADEEDELPEPGVRVNMKVLEGDEAYTYEELFGLMLHELGHVLGFRHEHTRRDYDDSNWIKQRMCFENRDYRPVTEYDSRSVMHYPQCYGENERPYELSEIDKIGASYFYPDEEQPAGRCDDELEEDGSVDEDCEPVANEIVEWLTRYGTEEVVVDWMGFDEEEAEPIVEAGLEEPFEDFDDLRERAEMDDEQIRHVYDYLYDWGRCPDAEVGEDGWVRSSCYPVVNGILELVNNTPEGELVEVVGLDGEAVEEISATRQERPIDHFHVLVGLGTVDREAVFAMYDHLYDSQ